MAIDEGSTERELVARFHRRLVVVGLRALGDPHAAEDVAQETLRRTVEACRAGKLRDPDSLPGFVLNTARNVCLHHRRKAGREDRALRRVAAGPGESDETRDPLAALVSDERRRAVRQALDQIGDQNRELLRMIFFEGLDHSDVAKKLGLTRQALRVRKHRALRDLASRLKKEES